MRSDAGGAGLPGLGRSSIVVGGGISGCAAALELRRLGYAVTILEAKSELGGILRDIEAGGERFFNGCQYFSAYAAWVGTLPERAGSHLQEFEQSYGSYSDLSGKVIAHPDFEAPVFECEDEDLTLLGDPAECRTLADRMGCYPPRIAGPLLDWIGRFGQDPASIDASNALHLQLSRLYLGGRDADIAALKASSSSADILLGLPRSVRGERHPQAALPKDGFDSFFRVLASGFEEEGIAVRTKAPAVPLFEGGAVSLRVRSDILTPDLVVWTANPVPVLLSAGIGRLDDPSIDMEASVGRVSGAGLQGVPHYIQVYEGDGLITRVFVYELAGQRRITVEHRPNGAGRQSLEADVRRICQPFYGEVTCSIEVSVPQRRHIFFSPHDKALFDAFRAKCEAQFPAFVDGAWEIYARDAKIAAITARIQARTALGFEPA